MLLLRGLRPVLRFILAGQRRPGHIHVGQQQRQDECEEAAHGGILSALGAGWYPSSKALRLSRLRRWLLPRPRVYDPSAHPEQTHETLHL